ncbi:hypothetical protein ACQP00_21950 [Dactylosporangium sp. CS-047395]|uniref:hypothetical protein n=1 Tax=Dactylosporangium sp. CS-047395 TaxID=3239936 RepID=UPI003D906F45
MVDLVFADNPVSLVLLRWPAHAAQQLADTTDLLAVCRLITTAATWTVVAVDPVTSDPSSTATADELSVLLSAARTAGLVQTQRIVAISSIGDEFLFYATDAETNAIRQDHRYRSVGTAACLELIMFRSR